MGKQASLLEAERAADVETQTSNSYRWVILALTVLTATGVAAAPFMALPVLFDEIANELGLNLVQIGVVWGGASVAGIFLSLVGGTIGDRFGSKRTLVVACALTGLTGALPTLATDFTSLLVTVLLFGLVRPIIPINLNKTCAVWFPKRELGLANGFVSAGMALGFLLGSLFSATFLSPVLGGWRAVLFFYAGLALVVCCLWLLTRSPQIDGSDSAPTQPVSLRVGLPRVVRLPNVWILGAAMAAYSGAVQGYLGYLPLYLRDIGWSTTAADGALAAFHGISLCAAIPIALASDRLGQRRGLLILGTLLLTAGAGLTAVGGGIWLWIAVVLAGVMRDGSMAIFMTTLIEVRGVGAVYAGTALGFMMMLGGVGRVLAPPLGNALAPAGLNLPFLFWAATALLALIAFYFFHPQEAA